MTYSSSGYAAKTYASNDPLRKLSHSARFRIALSLTDLPSKAHVLDFGGGDGAFLALLRQKKAQPFDSVLFEPYMDVVTQDSFKVCREWEEVVEHAKNRPFDLVFCQEVMEHFNPNLQDEALARITTVMAPHGQLILSVPVEIGPVALIKNVARWKYRKEGKEIYNYRNLLKSFFGLPIPEARSGDGYLNHMGFYYKDFQKLLGNHFSIERRIASPFSRLPAMLNSQVFFCAQPHELTSANGNSRSTLLIVSEQMG